MTDAGWTGADGGGTQLSASSDASVLGSLEPRLPARALFGKPARRALSRSGRSLVADYATGSAPVAAVKSSATSRKSRGTTTSRARSLCAALRKAGAAAQTFTTSGARGKRDQIRLTITP